MCYTEYGFYYIHKSIPNHYRCIGIFLNKAIIKLSDIIMPFFELKKENVSRETFIFKIVSHLNPQDFVFTKNKKYNN